MILQDMARIAFAEPFHPFRIQMEDGTTYHIHDPEMFALGVSKVQISTWMSEREEERKTRELSLLMSRIRSVQFLN